MNKRTIEKILNATGRVNWSKGYMTGIGLGLIFNNNLSLFLIFSGIVMMISGIWILKDTRDIKLIEERLN